MKTILQEKENKLKEETKTKNLLEKRIEEIRNAVSNSKNDDTMMQQKLYFKLPNKMNRLSLGKKIKKNLQIKSNFSFLVVLSYFKLQIIFLY